MMKYLILLFTVTCLTLTVHAQEVAGKWIGYLKVGDTKLTLILNIQKDGEGYKSTLDSPDQGATGIEVQSTTFQKHTLKLLAPSIHMSYEGTLKNDTIAGVFEQGGHKHALSLTPHATNTTLLRPQHPKPPYPYPSEEVKIVNAEAGITLAGTFTYPKGGKKMPAVVLITGSGAQNRDEEIEGHKPFLVLSDYLTRHGIAVLRCDDRGVGQSAGNFATATSTDFATDAYSAVKYLSGRKDVDKNKIGLIGHSEGALIAFMLASKYPQDIAFVVSMAGTGVPGKELMDQQSVDLTVAAGVSMEDALKVAEKNRELVELIEKHDEAYLKENIKSIMESILPPEQQTEAIMRNLSNSIARMSSPWFRQFIIYNPQTDLNNITCPIFVLNGDKDKQVNATINLNAINQHLTKSKSKRIKEYPNLNHLFQTAQTGLPSEYGILTETIAPIVLKDIATWIQSISK